LKKKKNVTGRISDTCRIVGFGLLTVFYSIKIGEGKLADIGTNHPCLIMAIGGLGFLVILFDYLQYFFGSMAVEAALISDNRYDDKSFAYKARNVLFILKQYAVLFGVGALLWLFVVI
jgi:hypothetical protein